MKKLWPYKENSRNLAYPPQYQQYKAVISHDNRFTSFHCASDIFSKIYSFINWLFPYMERFFRWLSERKQIIDDLLSYQWRVYQSRTFNFLWAYESFRKSPYMVA